MASTASSSYADAKVLFVSNNLGDSLSRVNAISSTSIATYALFAATIRLLAAQERHDAAGSSRRPQQQHLASSPATAPLHALKRLYRQARSSTPISRQARLTVVSIEFGAIVVPLLLSITVSSSTGAALTLSASLSLVAAAFYRQARLLESKAPSPAVARKSSVNGKGKAVASGDEDDDELAEETSALRSQSSYSNARTDSEQRRRAGAAKRRDSDDEVANNGDEDTSVDNRAAAAARRRKRRQRSHWESDDEEQELEEIERLESVNAKRAVQRPKDDGEAEGGGGFRVSIESAADQAYGEAHPPEAWVEPGARPEEEQHEMGSRASSPSPHGRIPSADGRASPGPNRSASSSRSNRRGLGLGLGLGLVPPRQAASPTTPSTRPLSSHGHDGFLTVYRSHMMLITVACILAVDFPLFPRVLGKCETWGASLMDLGVGSFVFSLGLVGAGAQLRQQENEARLPVKARGKVALRTLVGALRRDMGKCLPLLALGLLRALSVRLTAYPEHITEYGAHWSFFLTLSALPPLKTLVGALRSSIFGGKGRWSTWGLAIAAAHQAMLRWGGVQRFVLDEDGRIERTSSLLAANREGICSLPGYLAIMLLATDLGLYVLPKVDPYQAFRKVKLSKGAGVRGSDEDEEDEDDVDANADKAAITPAPLYGHARTGSDGRIDIKAALTSARRVQSKRLSSLCAILASWAVIYWAALSLSAWALSALLDDGHGGRVASPSIVAPWRGYGPEAALRSAPSTSTTPSGTLLVGTTNLLTRVISRRLANAPYVLWVAAFNASFLAAYACVYRGMLLDVEFAPPIALRRGHQRGSSSGGMSRGGRAEEAIEATSPASMSSSPTSSSFDSPYSSTFTGRPPTFGDLQNNDDSPSAQALQQQQQQQQRLPTTPLLLSSINTHSLRIFLIANLLTGVVNLSMKTMHASGFTAALVLTGYLAAVVWVAVGLDELGMLEEEEEQGRGRGFAMGAGKKWVRWVKGVATGRRRGR